MDEPQTRKTEAQAASAKPSSARARICGHLYIVGLLRRMSEDTLAEKMLTEWQTNNLPCRTCQGDPSMEDKCTLYNAQDYKTKRERAEETLHARFRGEISGLRKGY